MNTFFPRLGLYQFQLTPQLLQIRAIMNAEIKAAIDKYASDQDYRNALDDFRFLETAMREYNDNLQAESSINDLRILLENVNETASLLDTNKTFL
jgi:hypothetical protein